MQSPSFNIIKPNSVVLDPHRGSGTKIGSGTQKSRRLCQETVIIKEDESEKIKEAFQNMNAKLREQAKVYMELQEAEMAALSANIRQQTIDFQETLQRQRSALAQTLADVEVARERREKRRLAVLSKK